MKNSSYIIGNRTRDLPVCSAVPQPTRPPRAPIVLIYLYQIKCLNRAFISATLTAYRSLPPKLALKITKYIRAPGETAQVLTVQN